MKKASNILFIIGKVLNIIEIAVMPALIAVGIFSLANPEAVYEEAMKNPDNELTLEQVVPFGIAFIIAGIIALAVTIALFAIVLKSKKKIDNESTNAMPYVLLVVLGFVTENIFYFISGILEFMLKDQRENPKPIDVTPTE